MDENKRQKTLLQRGIDFLDAALVWDDPMRQERMDTRNEYGEARYQTIGKVSLGILFVVYTQRVYDGGKPVTRIISARPANKKEIQAYETRTFKQGLAL